MAGPALESGGAGSGASAGQSSAVGAGPLAAGAASGADEEKEGMGAGMAWSCPAGARPSAEPTATAAFPSASLCWGCGASLAHGAWLRMRHGLVAAQAENAVHPHHFDPQLELDLRHPVGRVVAHAGDRQLLGLENGSNDAWIVELGGGRRLSVQPGQCCNLAATRRLRTGLGEVEVMG